MIDLSNNLTSSNEVKVSFFSWNQFYLVRAFEHAFSTKLLLYNDFMKFFFFEWAWYVCIVCVTQCGNCCDVVSHIFGKNFEKVTLLKKLLKSWFDEIFFSEAKFFIFPHWEMIAKRLSRPWKDENSLSLKMFRKLLLSKSFSRNF